MNFITLFPKFDISFSQFVKNDDLVRIFRLGLVFKLLQFEICIYLLIVHDYDDCDSKLNI